MDGLRTPRPAGIALGIEAEMVLAVEMTASRSHSGMKDYICGTQS
jgi:hypothetical protein